VGAAALGHWLATIASTPASTQRTAALPEQGVGVLEATATYFGDVIADPAFPWTIHIRNTSDIDIEEVQVSASCDCLQVEPRTFKIDAKGHASLRLQLDLTRRSKSDSLSDESQPFRTPIQLTYQAGPKLLEQSFEVGGSVRQLVRIDKRSLDLGRISVVAQPLKPAIVPIEYVSADVTNIVATVTDQAFWDATVRPTGVGRWEMAVGAKCLLPIGTHKIPIAMTIATRRGASLCHFVAECTIADDIELSPSSVTLTPTVIGQEVTEILYVRSLSGLPIRIDAVSARSTNTRVEQKAIGEHEIALTLRHRITAFGAYSDTLAVTVTDAKGHRTAIECNCNFYGLAR
jgi:hypothetical protein